jgi:flagellar assembly protein FliH
MTVTAEDCKPWQLPTVEGPVCPGIGTDEITASVSAGTLEDLQKQAYEEAFEQGQREGFEAGYRDGQDKGRTEYINAAKQISQLVAGLAAPIKTMDERVQQGIADLAVLISRHIVRREIKIERGEVVGIVKEALAHLPIGAHNPRVRLNPADVDLVRNALSLDQEDNSYRIEPDPLIGRGGCLVETESSFVDATVEARLNAIVAKMLGGERESDRES